MASTTEYYRKVRTLIWPLLVVRTDLELPIDPQMRLRSENEQQVAKQLLRMPTGGAPTALVRHVEAWGKYLQAAPSFYEEQSALGYFAPPEKPDDSKEPGLLGKIFGTIFVLAASNTFEAMEKAERQKNARRSSLVAALDKRLDKRRAERDRLEATVERLGADYVPGFRLFAKIFFRYSLWVRQTDWTVSGIESSCLIDASSLSASSSDCFVMKPAR